MLSCRDLAQKHASDYLDGQLSVRQRFAVKLHLLMCTSCRRFVDQLRRVSGVIRQEQNIKTASADTEQLNQLAEQLHEEFIAQKKSSDNV